MTNWTNVTKNTTTVTDTTKSSTPTWTNVTKS